MHTYWVIPHRFLAGEYPTLSGRAQIGALLAAGVTDVISLVEPSEVAALGDYRPVMQEAASERGRSIRFSSFPIRDMDVPSVAQLRATLAAIDGILAAHRVVYLHCWGGFGRTGTIVGCYLVRHGFSGPAALAEIKRLRHDSPYAAHPSPERETQRAMVRTWAG